MRCTLTSAILVKVKYENVLYIAQNMRSEDRRELLATRFEESPQSIARDCINLGSFGWTIHREKPICAIGAFEIWPGVWRAWMFATDEFPRVGLYVTKFAKNIMMPTLSKNAHRAECQSIEGHTSAHKWLEAIGGERESTLKNYGKNKEDFYLYSYTWGK